MTIGYVYTTSNDINDWVYVGQSTRLDPDNLRTYLGGGDYLRNAMEELGREHFHKRIVSYHDTREDLDYAELLLIAEMRAAGANLLNGGRGGPRFEWPFIKAMSERFGPSESREGWLATLRDNQGEVKRLLTLGYSVATEAAYIELEMQLMATQNLSVACEKCGADIGAVCRTNTGNPARNHAARRSASV
ncbi:zinc finger domain-containing protein [Microbacterium sp. IEGM 1404]|uniref:zinc finger domain-containing protein n=1 Tax=Microbacterium sp. IEGM 1404 TaxID=3047084 RepID=UPI0024B6FFF6|nr:hypothetical protein [Microbacterium sp. IEGM 1404]MDI9892810.1 hypothetical protein [Microbacterium sp. IEGM 1404]